MYIYFYKGGFFNEKEIHADHIVGSNGCGSYRYCRMFRRRKGEKRNLGMIIITHNKSLAERVCTKVIELPKLNNVERADV